MLGEWVDGDNWGVPTTADIVDRQIHQADIAPFHACVLARQQQRAQDRMDQADELEAPAVAAIDEHGQHRGAGAADDACDLRLPVTVDRVPATPANVADLARGEHADAVPVAKPVHHLPKGPMVRA